MVVTILFSGWIALQYLSSGMGSTDWIAVALAAASVLAAVLVIIRVARAKAPGRLAWIAPLLALAYPVFLLIVGLVFVFTFSD